MLDRFYAALAVYRLGDLASILGLFVSALGFTLTLWQLARTKKAAEAAQAAAASTYDALARLDAVAECAAALAVLEEIRRLQRSAAWHLLPDRYSTLKRSLVTVRGAVPDLSMDSHKRIQAAIVQLARLEHTIEGRLAAGNGQVDVPRLNRVISQQIEAVAETLVEIRQQIGR